MSNGRYYSLGKLVLFPNQWQSVDGDAESVLQELQKHGYFKK